MNYFEHFPYDFVYKNLIYHFSGIKHPVLKNTTYHLRRLRIRNLNLSL